MKKVLALICIGSIVLSITGSDCEFSFGGGPNDKFKKKAHIEYDYSGNDNSYDRWSVGANEGTFASANFKIIKCPNVDRLNYEYFYFNYNDYNDLVNQLKAAKNSHRTCSTDLYRFYFDLSYYNWMGNEPQNQNHAYIGFGLSRHQPAPSDNWSFIFYENIRLEYPNQPNNEVWKWQSIVNWASAHELTHQIGNVIGHGNHTGNYQNLCVLNAPTKTDERFKEETSTYYICPYHKDCLANGPDLENPSMSAGRRKLEPLEFENKNFLEIQLSKNKFIEYEPILIRFRYINRSSAVDTIYDMFNTWMDDTKFIVINQDGDTVKKKMNLNVTKVRMPTYFVSSGDTIIRSMILTTFYGDTLIDDSYFHHSPSCLKPGKYTLNVEVENGWEKFTTTSMTFEVEKLGIIDEEVLELMKKNEFESILHNYQEHPFTEHVYAIYVLDSYKYTFVSPLVEKDSIIKLYRGFFDKYKDSYYNEDYSFIISYFEKLAKNSNEADVATELNNCIRDYKGSILGKFLNNKYNKSNIRKGVKELKKAIKDYEKRKK